MEYSARAGPIERTVAQREMVRYDESGDSDGEGKACASEDWARLFIARRGVRPPNTRATPGFLKQWRTIVMSSTT
eukprot:11197359-Lingulodinium_polyedra.AAC.1